VSVYVIVSPPEAAASASGRSGVALTTTVFVGVGVGERLAGALGEEPLVGVSVAVSVDSVAVAEGLGVGDPTVGVVDGGASPTVAVEVTGASVDVAPATGVSLGCGLVVGLAALVAAAVGVERGVGDEVEAEAEGAASARFPPRISAAASSAGGPESPSSSDAAGLSEPAVGLAPRTGAKPVVVGASVIVGVCMALGTGALVSVAVAGALLVAIPGDDVAVTLSSGVADPLVAVLVLPVVAAGDAETSASEGLNGTGGPDATLALLGLTGPVGEFVLTRVKTGAWMVTLAAALICRVGPDAAGW
jgi:hypothetical protein